jgi:hypothetical protein
MSQQTQSDIFHTKMLQNALWCQIIMSLDFPFVRLFGVRFIPLLALFQNIFSEIT